MANATFIRRTIVVVVSELAIFGALLFLPAETLAWPRAWCFLGVLAIAVTLTMILVFSSSEDLLNERFKGPIQKGQPVADRIIVFALLASFLALIAFISLDVFRFHLMPQPGPMVSSSGFVLYVAGWWIMALSLRENAFASSVIRHQAERHQTVIDTGVYRAVRHPMYAGAVLLLIGMPLWLGSYAAVLLSVVPIGVLVIRVTIEERFLRRELEGYKAYAQRVPYRLIPYLW